MESKRSSQSPTILVKMGVGEVGGEVGVFFFFSFFFSSSFFSVLILVRFFPRDRAQKINQRSTLGLLRDLENPGQKKRQKQGSAKLKTKKKHMIARPTRIIHATNSNNDVSLWNRGFLASLSNGTDWLQHPPIQFQPEYHFQH